MANRTKALSIEDELNPEPESKTWLVRVGCAETPMESPEVVPLSTDAIIIGRLDVDAPKASPSRIETADDFMSGDHLQLTKNDDGSWHLKDLESSNGTMVWGDRRFEATLSDGDIFQTGKTFWMLREQFVDGDVPRRPEDGVLGSVSPPFLGEIARIKRVSRTKVPIMLLGSTGTGKEVLSKAIHRLSSRGGKFQAINAGALQPNLAAAELFGVEKGAYSGAEQSRPGQIRRADGGSLLFDEVGDMPPEVQVAILRMLQESEVQPVGGDEPIKVDVRVICATHRDLDLLVRSGQFREDLFARFQGCTIQIPSLAERREDIGLLISRFLERYGGSTMRFGTPAYRSLLCYSWPRNIRELVKAIETACALAKGDRITIGDLPAEMQDKYLPKVAEEQNESSMLTRIVSLLDKLDGNVSKVARSMNMSRMTVHRFIKANNIDPNDYRQKK